MCYIIQLLVGMVALNLYDWRYIFYKCLFICFLKEKYFYLLNISILGGWRKYRS